MTIMVRCVLCGCSRWDSLGYKCALCGGSPAVRGEQVHVTFGTKANLLAEEEHLKRFGVSLENVEVLIKPAAAPSQSPGLVLTLWDDPVGQSELRELVHHLRFVGISEEELLRLRLGEPEEIAGYYQTLPLGETR